MITVVDAAESSLSNSDQWDSAVFDPSSLYGAPYGGYARAARHRLAQLPLRLVGGAEFEGWGGASSVEEGATVDLASDAEASSSSTTATPSHPHFRLSDADGQEYVCRVYHEDELDPHNVLSSMFDPPVLRTIAPDSVAEGGSAAFDHTDDYEGDDDDDDDDAYYYEDDEEYYYDHSRDVNDPEIDGMEVISVDPESGMAIMGVKYGGGGNKKPAPKAQAIQQQQHRTEPVKVDPQDIGRQLGKLEGICSQHHTGWWSYEWCNEKQVSQFHVHVAQVVQEDESKVVRHVEKKMEIQDVMTVGKFKQRAVRIEDDERITKGARKIIVDQGEDNAEKELSGMIIVTDTFDSGDWCEEFGVFRQVQVDIRCCPELQEKSTATASAKDKNSPIPGKAVLRNVHENHRHKCTYNTLVCTPLLCAEAFQNESVEAVQHSDGEENKASNAGKDGEDGERSYEDTPKKQRKRRKKKKNESVRDILDRALGNHCLQRNAGWWTYEFCHTRHAREFHGTNVMDATTGVSRQIVEEEHMLGIYKAEVHESYPDIEEPDHVVNATIDESAVSVGSSSKKKKKGNDAKKKVDAGSTPPEAGGNGAVYIQEYTNGLVCDHSDVAESIIKGGNVVGGGVERSTTVRFSCGKNYELVRVNEDSTCHYIFDVTVPALCGHPLFKATVAKTQVVKCLTVARY